MGDDVEEEPVGEDTQDEARGLKKPFSPLLPRRITKTEANLDWQSKARLTIRDSQLLLAALSGKVSRRVSCVEDGVRAGPLSRGDLGYPATAVRGELRRHEEHRRKTTALGQIHEDGAAKALHRETTLAWLDLPGK